MSAEVTIGLDLIGWILLFSGIGLVLAETMLPGGFLIVPGVVLIVLGGIGIIWPEMFTTIWAPLIVLCTAIPTTIITLYFYRSLGKPELPTTTTGSSLVGKTGIVTVDVIPNSLKGKVKINHDTWSATAPYRIPAGAKVKVVKSEGVHVEVEMLKEESEKKGKSDQK
ncbi:MAG: NfeD family protein [Thermoplasmata archaeon]